MLIMIDGVMAPSSLWREYHRIGYGQPLGKAETCATCRQPIHCHACAEQWYKGQFFCSRQCVPDRQEDRS